MPVLRSRIARILLAANAIGVVGIAGAPSARADHCAPDSAPRAGGLAWNDRRLARTIVSGGVID
jgi:hypothetical protein